MVVTKGSSLVLLCESIDIFQSSFSYLEVDCAEGVEKPICGLETISLVTAEKTLVFLGGVNASPTQSPNK
jgi:hypothetical protein